MAATSNAALFEKMEKEPVETWLDELIYRALEIKRDIVEADEREAGMRKILNFGHTVGHAVEAVCAPALLHGECVAIGMLSMSSGAAKARIERLLQTNGLPTTCNIAVEQVMERIVHDKKTAEDGIDCVTVEEIGRANIVRLSAAQIKNRILTAYRGN